MLSIKDRDNMKFFKAFLGITFILSYFLYLKMPSAWIGYPIIIIYAAIGTKITCRQHEQSTSPLGKFLPWVCYYTITAILMLAAINIIGKSSH